MKQTNLRISGSKFAEWACLDENKYRIRGVIEHFAHHVAAKKYQGRAGDNSQADNGQFSFTAHTQAQRDFFQRENMPLELQNSVLQMSESDISASFKALKLFGRPDQMQISFYAAILALQGLKVGKHGYVRTVNGGEVAYVKLDVPPLEVMKEILDYIK